MKMENGSQSVEFDAHHLLNSLVSAEGPIEHDDKVSEWLTLGACGLIAFGLASYDEVLKDLIGFKASLWLSVLLSASAASGLFSRLVAAAYLRDAKLLKSYSKYFDDHPEATDDEGTLNATQNALIELVPAWYRPYLRYVSRKSQEKPFGLHRRIARNALYQGAFSFFQKALFLVFVLAALIIFLVWLQMGSIL